ncbi:MAG: heparinase II/III-family protein, partial [Rudaea sp.]
LIADPGVYQYEAGEWRDCFRGTRAHSTLLIDGRDQSQLSSSFRVGRMARARITAAQLDGSPLFVRGELAGYTAPGSPLVHRRSLALPNSRKLVIQDEVEGSGEHDFELRFHLAPGARVSLERGAVLARFRRAALRFQFVAPSSAQTNVEEGWYSPSWYRRQPAPFVVLQWRGSAPCIIGTTLMISTGE